MATYEPIDHNTRMMVSEIKRSHHLGLAAADVQIAALFAYGPRDKNDNVSSPAIVRGGWQCPATIKVLPLKERVLGVGDALLMIDGDRWPEWPDRRRRALIDHELTHLQVKWHLPPDPPAENDAVLIGGVPETDDWDRPKLQLRLHDYEITGFTEVADRWGSDAFEIRTLSDMLSENGQYLLPYLDGIQRSIETPS